VHKKRLPPRRPRYASILGELDSAFALNDPSRNLFMKRFLIILPVLFAATAAGADDMTTHSMARLNSEMPRMDISNMDCAQLQSEMASHGKAILWWHSKSGLPRYGKYVSSEASCKNQQFRFRTAVGTTDMKSPHACPVIQCNNYGRPATH
jgi:hypothetical protein